MTDVIDLDLTGDGHTSLLLASTFVCPSPRQFQHMRSIGSCWACCAANAGAVEGVVGVDSVVDIIIASTRFPVGGFLVRGWDCLIVPSWMSTLHLSENL